MSATRSDLSSVVATGRGDDGTTGLLFGGPRIAKDDPRTEAYGTIDEAVAALGLARAELSVKRQYGTLPGGLEGLGELILGLQRDLFVVAAELATTSEAAARQRDERCNRLTASAARGPRTATRDRRRHGCSLLITVICF